MLRRRSAWSAIAIVTVFAVAACNQLFDIESAVLVDGGDDGASSNDVGAEASDGSSGTDATQDADANEASEPQCEAGATRCTDGGAQTCASDAGWELPTPCNAFCSQGACVSPPSCSGLALTCATSADCCAAALVPGGNFIRSYDQVTATNSTYAATVSDFLLDDYEVTVGRFRKFWAAYPSDKPSNGTGKNPHDSNDLGWDSSMTSALPALQSDLTTAIGCSGTNWTGSPTNNETKPMNCVSWYVAFAFCIWDGGRLPTEAEWNYAAAGGGDTSGQRVYPWSSPSTSQMINSTYAIYNADASANVGSTAANGAGRWLQTDLAGNLSEWVIDWYATPYPSTTCNDCANFTTATTRVIRGGSFDLTASGLTASARAFAGPTYTLGDVGFRCARKP